MADFRLGRLKFNWRGAWTASTDYVIDDIVKFGANTYVCTQNHTSVSSETNWYSTDLAKWSLHVEGIANRGDWAATTFYKVNDLVKFGNTQYRVVTSFASTSAFNSTNLVPYFGGFNYEGYWNSGTAYQPGDVVLYGGNNYVSKTVNTNKIPSSPANAADWDTLTTGFDFVGAYSTATSYVPGEVVRFGGYSYVAKEEVGAGMTSNPVQVPNKWDLIIKGFEWKGAWSSVTTYQQGDTIYRNSNSYVSIASTNLNIDPATDSLGTYWNPLTQGSATNVLSATGDIIYQSGAGPSALPIGANGKVLTVSPAGVPVWETNNVTYPVFYVAEEGSDSNTGENINRAFATIKHACGIVTGPATIYVKAGTYEEQLPITVPANVTIVGDNLRTTKIVPAAGNAKHQVLTLNSAPSSALVYGATVSNGAGTKTARILDFTFNQKKIEIEPLTGGNWVSGVDTWENGASDITIDNVTTLSNAQSTMFMLSDRTMLKDIVMEGMTGFQPAGTLITAPCSISGTILTNSTGEMFPDLVGTVISGTNIAVGTKVVTYISTTQVEVDTSQTVSQTNTTFTANSKDLNNAIVRGVFVKLNPNSPITKSPYVSNCSAFSSGGVGAVVDGKVHKQYDNTSSRSNKSIVFDSWTNIHDNGVGFWVTNNAAAEMVSCFTYYAHVSYCSTRGGRIRSLAGNSSWGNFGIVSSGYNTDEQFLSGTIEGLQLKYNVETITSPGFTQGERIIGATSGAVGEITSVQTSIAAIYYTVITSGPSGSGFRQNELITGQTSGTQAYLTNNTDANTGQNGFTIIVRGLQNNLQTGGSIEFVTGSGNGGVIGTAATTITGADPFTYVIQNVSYVAPDGRGNIGVNRAQLTTTAAKHFGTNNNIRNYPWTNVTATVASPIGASDTQIVVSSTAGFFQNGFVLTPTNELMKITNLDSSIAMTVLRAQEGAGIATGYSNGTTFRAIGVANTIGATQVLKDQTPVQSFLRVNNCTGFSTDNFIKIDNEFMKVTSIGIDTTGRTTLILAEEKSNKTYDEQVFRIRYLYSQVRLTGHDFLQIGTGGTSTTNWPGVPTVDPIPSREVTEDYPGRVYYVSTDQNGNFRVGKYFRVNQATGAATLNASAFDLSGLTSLRLGSIGAQLGAQINEFSTDITLSQNSNEKVPTQAAVKSYVDTSLLTTRPFTYWVATS
jgi:hypothetical protein